MKNAFKRVLILLLVLFLGGCSLLSPVAVEFRSWETFSLTKQEAKQFVDLLNKAELHPEGYYNEHGWWGGSGRVYVYCGSDKISHEVLPIPVLGLVSIDNSWYMIDPYDKFFDLVRELDAKYQGTYDTIFLFNGDRIMKYASPEIATDEKNPNVFDVWLVSGSAHMNDLFARMQIGQSSDLTVLELFSSLTSNIELNTVVTYENIRLKALPCEKLYDESGYQFLVEIAE